MNTSDYRVKPGKKVDLKKWDANDKGSIENKEAGKALLSVERDRIAALQERLYAEGQQSLLVIVQATDTGGKDGAIKNVFKGVNPAGVHVWSFKVPTQEELEHDFLWRYHLKTPRDGMIGVFNRSQYEEVLVVRVHDLVPEEHWSQRYELINSFEKQLVNHGTRVLKFYLHITKEEQKERLQARIDEPEKNWKFNTGDLKDRDLWEDYQAAFEDALTKCSTDYAPWYVIPANRKWFRNLLMARIIADTMEEMDPQFPAPEEGLHAVVIPD